MKCVLFKFKPDCKKEGQKEVFKKLRALREVEGVDNLDLNATDPNLLLECYVYVKDEADPDQMVNYLQAQPEIEYVEIPPNRYAV
jgi:hypothetical protein